LTEIRHFTGIGKMMTAEFGVGCVRQWFIEIVIAIELPGESIPTTTGASPKVTTKNHNHPMRPP
jgi:hypothetical protein